MLTFKYNDIETLKATIKANPDVAAVILTPINHPLGEKVEFPKNNFLKLVRDVCDENKIVLIFDEIRSGFRVDLGGAQKLYNVTPDLATFGKAMANGYSIAALVGKKEIMQVYEKKAFISATYFENGIDIIASITTINF